MGWFSAKRDEPFSQMCDQCEDYKKKGLQLIEELEQSEKRLFDSQISHAKEIKNLEDSNSFRMDTMNMSKKIRIEYLENYNQKLEQELWKWKSRALGVEGKSQMGMYCCCGVKKRIEGWDCECDWNGWFLCFKTTNVPEWVPIKHHPKIDGTYLVRVFEDGDDNEDESEFSITEKNWRQPTNQAISRWKIEYNDNWTGYRGVYAWKGKALGVEGKE